MQVGQMVPKLQGTHKHRQDSDLVTRKKSMLKISLHGHSNSTAVYNSHGFNANLKC